MLRPRTHPHQTARATGHGGHERPDPAPVRWSVVPDSAPSASAGRSWRDRLPAVSPRAFRRLALASLVLVIAIVLTGAAVRLTTSGLGCADWPECFHGHLTPPLHFHAIVEFTNRLITVGLTVVFAVTFCAALCRRPYRRDLTWLAAGLVAGVFVQAGMGAIVVYTTLNPFTVMVHFVATVPLVALAVVLVHRATRDYAPGSGRLLVPRPVLYLGRLLVALLAVVVAAGTAVTGAGPHAGSFQGQVRARRLPVSLRDMAELHSSLALLLVGVALATAVGLHALEVPDSVRRAARILVVVLVAQAAVGYTQYFTHLPPLLVELHVAGALVLVVGTVQFLLALTHHRRETTADTDGPPASAPQVIARDARPQPATGKGGVAVGR
jgi:heme a synthase